MVVNTAHPLICIPLISLMVSRFLLSDGTHQNTIVRGVYSLEGGKHMSRKFYVMHIYNFVSYFDWDVVGQITADMSQNSLMVVVSSTVK